MILFFQVRRALCPAIFGKRVFLTQKAADYWPMIHTDVWYRPILGIYKQYAEIDLKQATELLQAAKSGFTPSSFELKTLFAQFGKDTIYSILEGNLRILEVIRKELEDTEFEATIDATDSSEVYHPDLRRLAFSLMKKIYLSDDGSKLLSYLQKNMTKTSERDILMKIGRFSPAFTMVGGFNSQEDFREMLQSATPQISQELNNCFFETKSTRQIQLLDWPRDLNLLTVRSEKSIITQKQLEDQLASAEDKVTRVITVRMLNLEWFYRDRKNFAAFSDMLQELPDEVYATEFIECLLDIFWADYQLQIIKWQFVPYLTFISIAISYMYSMLADKQQHAVDSEAGFDLTVMILGGLTSLFIVNQLRLECYQLIGLENKMEYFSSFWNMIDLTGLLLTLTIVFLSFFLNDIGLLSVLTSFASFFLLIKVFDWLRLFEQTAFYILLVGETLRDVKAFLILLVTTLMVFGVPMIMLNMNRSPDVAIVDAPFGFWVINMFLNQYLLALGEFNFDNFADNPQAVLCYFFFIMATFVTQLTMLNMLIAIMGDTFARVVENADLNSTKTKLELMADVSTTLQQTTAEETKEVFVFVVRPDTDNADTNVWEGTLNKITSITEKSIEQLRKSMFKRTDKIQETLDEYAKADKAGEKHLKTYVD